MRFEGSEWGEVSPEHTRENGFSVKHGFPVLSSYLIGEAGAKVWIITEADRPSTCLLLPSE